MGACVRGMAYFPVYTVLALCVAKCISGQTVQAFFDLGTEIRQSLDDFGSHTPLVSTAGNGARRMCYDGSRTVYYTNGNAVLRGIDSRKVLAAPPGYTIYSLTCCCNIVSIAFQDSQDGSLHIWTVFTLNEYFIAKFNDTSITSRVIIKCLPESERIIVVSASRVWTIRFNDLFTLVPEFTFSTELTGILLDVACCSNHDSSAGGFDLFFLTGGNDFSSARYNGVASAVTRNEGELSSPGTIFSNFAITAGNDAVYILTTTSLTNWQIRSFVKATFLTGGNLQGNIELQSNGGHGLVQGQSVHGFEVCDEACQNRFCDDGSCNCTDACGACVDFSDVCQCTDSQSSTCCYSDMTIGDFCGEPPPVVDACVFLSRPNAARRGGPPINIVGVSRVPANIRFTRYVDSGRYRAPNLPQHNPWTSRFGPDLWISGLSVPPRSEGRGRRFGVYAGMFTPAGMNAMDNFTPVTIVTIAAESSGFTNALFCYTVNHNETVKLVSRFQPQLERFTEDLEWRFTRVDQETGQRSKQKVPLCSFEPNRLTCVLRNVTKAADEGAYEVYRRGRQLRNWHPFFLLLVRQCRKNLWGPSCVRACPVCEQGWCDVITGKCVCYPGWMGLTCNTACPTANDVGAQCDIRCHDVFSGNQNCKGLLISKPGKVPCACRSGLSPPDCIKDCPKGYWGPNCMNQCSSAVCNARTGESLW